VSEMLRVLVADDHPLVRAGLRSTLELAEGVELVGEVQTGDEAVRAASQLDPDVVVMDIHMPGLNGIDATREIIGRRPDVGVLVLTMFDDDASVFAAMRAGARGYVLKGADQAEILRAVEAVGRGEAIFGPAIAQRVIEFMAQPATAPQPFPELTSREREVLELIAQGLSNAKIAERFVLSQKTVRNHVSNILTKLRVADRSQAIVQARDAGFGRA
jgi:DNA-binding NarL/FixJ family response regulator